MCIRDSHCITPATAAGTAYIITRPIELFEYQLGFLRKTPRKLQNLFRLASVFAISTRLVIGCATLASNPMYDYAGARLDLGA